MKQKQKNNNTLKNKLFCQLENKQNVCDSVCMCMCKNINLNKEGVEKNKKIEGAEVRIQEWLPATPK